jgi:hypothetical protein
MPSKSGEDRCSKVFIVSGLLRTEANASQTPLSKLFELKAEGLNQYSLSTADEPLFNSPFSRSNVGAMHCLGDTWLL